MKFILSLLLISPFLIFSQTDFSNGYRSGWKAGYCYQESFCSSPNPPSAPIPNLSENSFQDGYNRGFSDGKASKSLKVQNQTQTNNNLIEGAGNAYGNGTTVNGNSAFEKYNASNNYGIQPIKSDLEEEQRKNLNALKSELKKRLLKIENYKKEYLKNIDDKEMSIWYSFKKITYARAYNADAQFFNDLSDIDVFDEIKTEHIKIFIKYSSGKFKNHEKDAKKAMKRSK